jgi:hypothetical protein
MAALAGAAAVRFVAGRNLRQPADRPAGATPELLIGSWKMTRCDHPPIAPEVEMLLVFADNGRFEWHSVDPRNGRQLRAGTYRLDGNTIHLDAEPTARYEAASWDETIELIDADKLVLVGVPEPGNRRPRIEFQRTNEKKLPPLQRPSDHLG